MKDLIRKVLNEEVNDILYNEIMLYISDMINYETPDYIDSFIIIWDKTQDEVAIEYDKYDGRLYISKNYMNRVQNYIPLNKKIIGDIIKYCFEKKFNINVSFISIEK
jgi:hypothetical protein